jgi:hypothetical protein
VASIHGTGGDSVVGCGGKVVLEGGRSRGQQRRLTGRAVGRKHYQHQARLGQQRGLTGEQGHRAWLGLEAGGRGGGIVEGRMTVGRSPRSF